MKRIFETISDIYFDSDVGMFSILASLFTVFAFSMLKISFAVSVPISIVLLITSPMLPYIGTTIMTFIWIFAFIVGFIEPYIKSFNGFAVLIFYILFAAYLFFIVVPIIATLCLYLKEHFKLFKTSKKIICISLLAIVGVIFIAIIIAEISLASSFIDLKNKVLLTYSYRHSWIKEWIFKK